MVIGDKLLLKTLATVTIYNNYCYICVEKRTSITLKHYRTMNVKNLMADLERKHPGESEYLQAVREVLESVEEVYNQHP